MDTKRAITTIEKTFDNAFNKDNFFEFVQNLLNGIDTSKYVEYRGNLIKEAFREHIAQYTRLGKYTDPNGDALDVLIIEVKEERKLDQARTSLRNFVISHLKNFDKDYALAAFYSKSDEGRNWRFSFIKLENKTTVQEGKIKQQEELTPARRFSFLVGEDEKSHTAKRQLLPLLQNVYNNPLIEDLEKAFSIEVVTDEFFEQYKNLFIKLSSHFEDDKQLKSTLDNEGIDIPRFTKKLLGQIVFLYFLQKKGWLGVPQNDKWGNGQKDFIQQLYNKAADEGKNFFNEYLQYLFYEALARQHGEDNYYKRFDCRIPFLNGGLFEADYEWNKQDIDIPNHLFRNDEKVKKTGDEGTGILDVFDRYNFTIREDEPLEKEVAVDPEMLGKVFENLQETIERKKSGTFYTPREIVHYMCQESLIHYLDNALNADNTLIVPKEDIEDFVRKGIFALDNDIHVAGNGKETKTYKYQLPQSILTNADAIDKLITDVKICDPAIGSGAFPVGLLNELVNLQLVLREHLSETYLSQKLDLIGLKEKEYSENTEKYTYRIKRHSIQESIYGIDIDTSAIDIARLRLWLSLVVDEEDFDNIEALPNLDYKIVAGNSLINKLIINNQEYVIDIDWATKTGAADAKEYVETTISKLQDLSTKQKDFFEYIQEQQQSRKSELRTEIRNLKIDILINQISFNREKYRHNNPIHESIFELSKKQVSENQIIKDKLEEYNETIMLLKKLQQEESLQLKFFDWNIDFPDIMNPYVSSSTGFDIVIGNPPYGGKLSTSEKEYLKVKYSDVHMRTPDTFNYFISKGYKVLINKGVLSYIVPNNLFFQNEYEKTRDFLLSKNRLYTGVNLGDGVFNTATVPSCIFIGSKTVKSTNKDYDYTYADLRKLDKKYINFNTFFENQSSHQTLSNPAAILGISDNETQIIQALRKVSVTIDDIAEEMASGISTGGDKIFRVTKQFAEENQLEKGLLRPVLVGGEIDKYRINNTNHLLIYTNRTTDIETHPYIKGYLAQNMHLLIKRSETKAGILPWYVLNRQRYPELFEYEKIIMRQTADIIRATYDDKGFYTLDSILVFKKKENSEFGYKYILAVLNSAINAFLYSKFTQENGRTFAQVKPLNVRKLFVPKATTEQQYIVSVLVNYLLEYKALQEEASSIIPTYFSLVIDSIIYELFFQKEIHTAQKGIIEHLQDLKPIDDTMTDEKKIAIINSEFERLYDPYHPVRNNVETLENVEVVRIIKEALRK